MGFNCIISKEKKNSWSSQNGKQLKFPTVWLKYSLSSYVSKFANIS